MLRLFVSVISILTAISTAYAGEAGPTSQARSNISVTIPHYLRVKQFNYSPAPKAKIITNTPYLLVLEYRSMEAPSVKGVSRSISDKESASLSFQSEGIYILHPE